MKNIFFICICALFAFTGCTDDDDELLANGDTNINLLPNPQPNGVINEKLFEVINLDYPGLEKVKEYYEANEYYYAAHELLKYYRNRSDVSNPNINLINPSITAFDQNIADQALEHRFYVRNFKEKEENGKEVYYLFDKDKNLVKQVDTIIVNINLLRNKFFYIAKYPKEKCLCEFETAIELLCDICSGLMNFEKQIKCIDWNM